MSRSQGLERGEIREEGRDCMTEGLVGGVMEMNLTFFRQENYITRTAVSKHHAGGEAV